MIYMAITGSIGAGKSTVLKMIQKAGFFCIDSDQVVHHLLKTDTEVVRSIQQIFPAAVISDRINLAHLRHILDSSDPSLLRALEAVLHPKVYHYIDQCLQAKHNQPLLCAEIPLLFETYAPYTKPDFVCAVHTTARLQQKRALSRPGMTRKRFYRLLRQQLPAHEKLKRANWVIYSYNNPQALEKRVMFMLNKILHLPIPK